ncbi:hypothetical protein BCR39DRAFT_560061 [Naematelia encephala]|uniref:Uncharacterized protein n=1 Tax=Naematelia encephala TaxID=71784 RepID=A0A1Y2AXL6_9TREE|nr:hypothetical protein BCR39DRAFT_560061 [Naematelia encephala]
MMVEIDNLTLFLLSLLVILALWHRFSTPTPLVHPLLLGKQAEVSSVRKKGETGVYRSWATGQGSPLTVRPANGVKVVRDVLPEPKGPEGAQPRCILDTNLSDEALSEILRLVPQALFNLFPSLSLLPAAPTPILTLLPPSPSCQLPLLLLSLAAPPSTPIIPLPHPSLLASALEEKTAHPRPGLVVVHASLIGDVLEQIVDENEERLGVLVVGDPDKACEEAVQPAKDRGMVVSWWEEIWDVEGKKDVSIPDAHFNDTHSYFYHQSENGDVQITKFTHLNITAGIAGTLSLFPADKRPSRTLKDVVASAVRLDTPFGMTLAVASIWSGAGFRMLGRVTPDWPATGESIDARAELNALAQGDSPSPSLLFLTKEHHEVLVQELQSTYARHPLASLVARHKLAGIKGGHVSRDSWTDKLALRNVRGGVLGNLVGESLRSVFLVGDDFPDPSAIALSHLLLSLPVPRVFISPSSAGPVLATHYYDIQSPGVHPTHLFQNPPADGEASHAGAPASNVEVVLRGSEGELGEMKGTLWVRGPGVGEVVSGKINPNSEGWADCGHVAKVRPNGTFVLV